MRVTVRSVAFLVAALVGAAIGAVLAFVPVANAWAPVWAVAVDPALARPPLPSCTAWRRMDPARPGSPFPTSTSVAGRVTRRDAGRGQTVARGGGSAADPGGHRPPHGRACRPPDRGHRQPAQLVAGRRAGPVRLEPRQRRLPAVVDRGRRLRAAGASDGQRGGLVCRPVVAGWGASPVLLGPRRVSASTSRTPTGPTRTRSSITHGTPMPPGRPTRSAHSAGERLRLAPGGSRTASGPSRSARDRDPRPGRRWTDSRLREPPDPNGEVYSVAFDGAGAYLTRYPTSSDAKARRR